MKTGHAWETERQLMREKKCWATAVLAGALTAELSLGSLTAVFAIFIPSKEELRVLYIQGNSYMIHVGWTVHYRHCTDSSFHMNEECNERSAILVFTHINCLHCPLLAAYNVTVQFKPEVLHFITGLRHRIKQWWKLLGMLQIASKTFILVPSKFCALLVQLQRKRTGKKESFMPCRN